MTGSHPDEKKNQEGKLEKSHRHSQSHQAAASVAVAEEPLAGDMARMLRTLLGNLDGMVYRCRDDDAWTMEFVSEGCRRLTGYDADDLLFNRRLSYEALTHPEDRRRVREEIRAALRTSGRFDCEYRIVHANGEPRWVWERGSGVFDADGRLVAIEGIVQDITARKRSHSALREAERRYYNLFENALEGIFRTTLSGQFLDANPALARIFGFADPGEMSECVGEESASLYVDPGRRREFLRILEERGRVTDFDSQARRKDGTIIWISENARAVRKPDGRLDWCEGTVVDITERKRMEERLVRGALYDALTGLPNRSLLTELMGRALERVRRKPGTLFAALVIDLDRFKMVNDSMGHAQGDRLLLAFARRLLAFLPPDTTLGRMGADEFCLLVDDLKDDAPAMALADRIQEALSLPFELEGREVYAAASIGIVVGTGSYAGPEEILRDADTAMHRAKMAGKGRYEIFDSSMHAKAVKLLTLETDLRRAVERDEFLLHYQPIVSLEDGSLTGFEALIRWRHPRMGLVPPLDFIPLAEDTGLIVPIGKWVLRKACLQLAEWRGLLEGGRKLTMSVNISGKQLDGMDFAEMIQGILLEARLEPSCLKLEVTESAIMEHPEAAAAILERLKEMGVRLSLDDFGTGYSSLSYLHRFPFHNLKIDRSFISKLEGGEKDEEIVRVINSLARNLGMDVVAEGIETKSQWDLLHKLDCGFGQGYYFSRPLEDEAARRLIESGAAPFGT